MRTRRTAEPVHRFLDDSRSGGAGHVSALEFRQGWRLVQRGSGGGGTGRRLTMASAMTSSFVRCVRAFALMLSITSTAAATPATPDDNAAFSSVMAGAEAGDAEAQNRVAWLYFKGRSVPQDFAQALAWFRRAADAGFAPAQTNVGMMHHNG